jgi:hypothetical protein
LANCSPTPASDEQFPALANVGVLEAAEVDLVDVLGGGTVTEAGLDTVVVFAAFFAAGFLVVVVAGVLEPPQPATSTAKTAPTDSSRNLIYQSPW